MLQRIGLSAGGVEEVEGITSVSLPEEFTAGVHVGMLDSIHRLAGTDAVKIVGIANCVYYFREGTTTYTLDNLISNLKSI